MSDKHEFADAISVDSLIPFPELLRIKGQWGWLAVYVNNKDDALSLMSRAIIESSVKDDDEAGVSLIFLIIALKRHWQLASLFDERGKTPKVGYDLLNSAKENLRESLVSTLKEIWGSLPKDKDARVMRQIDVDERDWVNEKQPAMQRTKELILTLLAEAWGMFPSGDRNGDELLLWLSTRELRYKEPELMENAFRQAHFGREHSVHGTAYVLRGKPETRALEAIVKVLAHNAVRCWNSEDTRAALWQHEQFRRLSGSAQAALSKQAEHIYALDVCGRELCEVLKKQCSEHWRAPVSYLIDGENGLILEVYQSIPGWHRRQNDKLDQYLEEYLKMKKILEEPAVKVAKSFQRQISVLLRYRAGYGDRYAGNGANLEIEKEARII